MSLKGVGIEMLGIDHQHGIAAYRRLAGISSAQILPAARYGGLP